MKSLSILIVCLFTIFSLAADSSSKYAFSVSDEVVLPLDKASPAIRVVNESESYVRVNYKIDTIIFEPDTLYDEANWCYIDNFGTTYEAGTASLPIRIDNIRIPVGYDSARVVISKLSYKDIPCIITPSHPLLPEGGSAIYTKDNVPPIKASAFDKNLHPVEILYMETTGKRNYAIIKVQPCQYDSQNGILRVVTELEYIVYPISPSDNSSLVRNNRIREEKKTLFKSMMKSIQYGDDVYEDGGPLYIILDDSNFTDLYRSYLIVTCDKYLEAAERLSLMKKKMGFTTYMSVQSRWSENQIKDSIQSYYDRDPDLEFVVLLGGYDDLPASIRTSQEDNTRKVYPTDFYYGCMNGVNDRTQDVYIGRIPITNIGDANVVVSKLEDYFFKPIWNTDFYSTAIHVAEFGDSYYDVDGYVKDSENCRDIAVGYNKEVVRLYWAVPDSNPECFVNSSDKIPEELKKPNYSWDANKQSIAQSINNGAFYVMYRGHGSTDRWNNPEFRTTDTNLLSNTNKLPLFINTTCWSGKYNDTIECLSSSLLRHSNGGAIGVIGGSERTRTDLNSFGCVDLIKNFMQKGTKLFTYPNGQRVTCWDEYQHSSTLGCIREGMFVTATAYNHPYMQSYKEMYHVFGDPSTMIWTDTPRPFESYEILERIYYRKLSSLFPTSPEFEVTHQEVAINLEDEACFVGVYDSLEDKSYLMFGTRMAFPYFDPVRYEMTVYGVNRLPYTIHRQQTASFETVNPNNPITIMPNPASSMCVIGYTFYESLLESVTGKIQICSATNGRLVMDIAVDFCIGRTQVDVSGIDAGEYVVSLQDDNGKIRGTSKLIVYH